ncbi:N-acetylgalactosaminyltransferase 7 [Bulinus truncatus]|nr:N-acetylgalactosaminyltransferase 7 [Bulinus truncatus]
MYSGTPTVTECDYPGVVGIYNATSQKFICMGVLLEESKIMVDTFCKGLVGEDTKTASDAIIKLKIKHEAFSPSTQDLSLPKLKTKSAFLTNEFGNFEPPELVPQQRPGENGKPVSLSLGEGAKAEDTIQGFGFNMIASDKVSMNRSVPDTRLKECKHWHYSNKQPKASVVIVFHNEGFTTLVRTIHSVINTSPAQFLKEIVLVDDFSDKSHLKEPLNDYITKEFKDVVKLFRNNQREGLIRARTRGAELATGEVIIFLDAHCECNRNWLVPLLDRIRQNRTVLAEAAVPEQELKKRKFNSEPYFSPTHAGGLFAIERTFFFELGGYDPGLRIWGGENYELSFKVWLCGGSIEWVPCSRVGHIYRNHMPYSLGTDVDPKMMPIYINYMRVVEVWMEDEFKEYFYTREPSFRGYPFGDITKQIAFKEQHHCKSFKWFMENVAYDVYEHYPAPPPNKAWGEIRFKDSKSNLCWDSGPMQEDNSKVSLKYCHGSGHSQQYRLNVQGQIGIGERCIEVKNGRNLMFTYCLPKPVGPWEWDQESGLIRHKVLKKCVAADNSNQLQLKSCDNGDPFFKWNIREVYPWKKKS